MSTLIVAFILLPVALALGVGIVVLLARPLVAPVIAARERWWFRRCVTHGLRGDTRLREQQLEPALREMEQAFCMLIVRADPRLPDQIDRHHAGLLARLLTVADDLPQGRVRLLALAKVDRLLDRRSEMQRAYTQLRTRPFRDARRVQLERELRRNARDTRVAVRELIADLQLLSTRKVAYQ